jgi:GNAT superfamily N-acetyltransferase
VNGLSYISQHARIAGRASFQFRAAEPDDRVALHAFLGRLSQSTVAARYLQRTLNLAGPSGDREVDRLLGRRHAGHVVLLAMDGADVRGIGELFSQGLNRADLGVVVEDAFQGRGIGRALLRTLEKVALNRGIRALTGDMAYGNARAVALLRGTGRPIRTQVGSGGVSFTLTLQA